MYYEMKISLLIVNYLFLMPLAIFSESIEHQVVAFFREELRPIAYDRHSTRSVAQTKLTSFFDEPKKLKKKK